MQVIRRDDASEYGVSFLGGRDSRRGYKPIYEKFKITETMLPAGVLQTPHAHQVVREATYVVEGKITVAEIKAGKRDMECELEAGDLVVFDPRSCHVMENKSNVDARTLTFKFLGEGDDVRLLDTDKIEDCSGPIKPENNPLFGLPVESYVSLHTSIDKLQWQVPGTVIVGSALLAALVTPFFKDQNGDTGHLSKEVLCGVLCFVGVVYGIAAYGISRLRKNRKRVERILADMERPSGRGYFLEREGQKVLGAARAFMVFFWLVAIGCFILGSLTLLGCISWF